MIRKDRTPSRIVKRSVKIAGHDSSVSLEDAFWGALREIATAQNIGLSELVSRIAKDRQNKNLSSAIRVFVLGYHRQCVEYAPDFWRKRAEEARRLAERIEDSFTSETLLNIALQYDELALHAEQRQRRSD